MSEDLAWAAGFIDGEGTFGVQRGLKTKRKNILFLQAGQVDQRVLFKLQEILGDGKVYGPYQPKRNGHSPYSYYRLTNTERTIKVAKLLWPWLSDVKKEQYGRAIRLVTEPALKADEP